MREYERKRGGCFGKARHGKTVIGLRGVGE